MALINLKGPKKTVAMRVEPVPRVDDPADLPVAEVPSVNPARQRRARVASAAAIQWEELETYADQLEDERDAWRRRALDAESEAERLREREATAFRQRDEEKELHREALATAMACFTACAPLMLDAHQKIQTLTPATSSARIDMQSLAEQLREREAEEQEQQEPFEPLPSVVTQGPAMS